MRSVSRQLPKVVNFHTGTINIIGFLYFILFYSHTINIGNYSYLSYTFGGVPTTYPIFEVVKYSRLPLQILGLIVVTVVFIRSGKLRDYFLKNIDVFVFGFVLYLGLKNSVDIISGIMYSIWHTVSIVCTMAFLFFMRRSGDIGRSFFIIFRLIFWSNFVVLILLIPGIRSLGQEWVYNMAFTSKAFYPYCLLSIVISMYMTRLLNQGSVLGVAGRRGVLIESVIVFATIVFCFVSARRTPLFLIILLSLIYGYFMVGRAFWKKVLLIGSVLLVGVATIPNMLQTFEEKQLELSIFRKLNLLSQSKGNLKGDQSYSDRLRLWQMYDEIHAKYPIVGVGSYNSTLYQERLNPTSDLAGYSPHNLYRGILVEHGWIGFIAFIIMLVRSVYFCLKKLKFRVLVFYFGFFLLPVLIINWNEYNLIPGQVFYWTTMLAILTPRVLVR